MSAPRTRGESPYKVLLDLLLEALPATDEVLAVNIDARAGFSPTHQVVDASAVTVRAITFGLLREEERRRFCAWPNRPLAKHWVGTLEGPGRLRMVLISLDPTTGA